MIICYKTRTIVKSIIILHCKILLIQSYCHREIIGAQNKSFDDEEQGTISPIGFENSPCKRRDNSDVHRRDTGLSTACCRPAVSLSKKKTTVSAAEYLRTKHNDLVV